jgi:hypothetical protein
MEVTISNINKISMIEKSLTRERLYGYPKDFRTIGSINILQYLNIHTYRVVRNRLHCTRRLINNNYNRK